VQVSKSKERQAAWASDDGDKRSGSKQRLSTSRDVSGGGMSRSRQGQSSRNLWQCMASETTCTYWPLYLFSARFSPLYLILLHPSILYIILYPLYPLWDPLVTLSKYIHVWPNFEGFIETNLMVQSKFNLDFWFVSYSIFSLCLASMARHCTL
jgi:hypothetical protein